MIKHPFTEDDIPYKNKSEYMDNFNDYNNSPIALLFPIIDNKIFHRRSLKDMMKILTDGYIYCNNGYYEKTDGSENCFAYKNKYISFFDFHQLPFNIYSTYDKWWRFLFDKTPVTVLMQFDRNKISTKLKSNGIRRCCPNQTGNYFPYVESWHPEPVPIDWIEKIYVTFTKNGEVHYEQIKFGHNLKGSDSLPSPDDTSPELPLWLQNASCDIQSFCNCLLRISQVHKLNLEDPLKTILTSQKVD